MAAFDCDGTLWAGDSGEGFFNWEMERGLVSDEIVRWGRARYADYRAGKVDEDTMCGEMATMHCGLRESDVQAAAQEFFDENLVSSIFPDMRDLVERLQQAGCDVWAVSSTNDWVIRAGMKHFGIAATRILAAAAKVENGVITDRLLRVPSGPGKAHAVREVAQRDPDAAFGNSRWDIELLEIASNPFAINPNPDLDKLARQRGWTIYWPEHVPV